MIRVAVRRLFLASEALRGRFDGIQPIVDRLAASEALVENLRKVVMTIHLERQYWYDLWFGMGREFENAQNAMIEEIGNLRQKLGIKGDRWEEKVKEAFHVKYVAPAGHPVPGVRCEPEKIEYPPVKPSEAGNG